MYKLSDFLSYLLHKVFKYRLKTVQKNLKLVFNNKEKNELEEIEKKFYNHFADISIESIKAFGMSKKQMKERYTYENIEKLEEIQKKNKNIILICGHYSNFEWLLSIGYNVKGNGYGIYTPMTNKYFDRLFKKIRGKHNAFLVSRYNINDFMNNLDVNKYHVFASEKIDNLDLADLALQPGQKIDYSVTVKANEILKSVVPNSLYRNMSNLQASIKAKIINALPKTQFLKASIRSIFE